MEPIRILVVDDHAMVRAGLRMLIDQYPEMEVVGMTGEAGEAIALAASLNPDVIVLDIVLGENDGLTYLPKLREAAPKSRVIVLTGLRSVAAHRQALRHGALGVVLKDHAAEVLIKAINKVHDGEVWVERSMMGTVLQDITKPDSIDPEKEKIASLTEREQEVISHIGQGLKNKQIADRLFISETTVTHHLSSIFSKLAVKDRLELVIYALKHKLVGPPQ
jgi:DNA-binding NarL/FixJ family response regulator